MVLQIPLHRHLYLKILLFLQYFQEFVRHLRPHHHRHHLIYLR
jgi:hypothetical protein